MTPLILTEMIDDTSIDSDCDTTRTIPENCLLFHPPPEEHRQDTNMGAGGGKMPSSRAEEKTMGKLLVHVSQRIV